MCDQSVVLLGSCKSGNVPIEGRGKAHIGWGGAMVGGVYVLDTGTAGKKITKKIKVDI